MDFFLEEYLRHGLSDIFEIDSSEKESEAGYGTQDYWKTVVAKKGGEFVKIAAHHHAWFGFKGGNWTRIDSEEPISAADYSHLTAGMERVDTPEKVSICSGESRVPPPPLQCRSKAK